MNPYLEHPDRWSTVHNRLIVALADALTPQLLPKYQVDIEKRVYTIVGMNSLLLGRPERPRQPLLESTGQRVASAPLPQPIKVSVPTTEDIQSVLGLGQPLLNAGKALPVRLAGKTIVNAVHDFLF